MLAGRSVQASDGYAAGADAEHAPGSPPASCVPPNVLTGCIPVPCICRRKLRPTTTSSGEKQGCLIAAVHLQPCGFPAGANECLGAHQACSPCPLTCCLFILSSPLQPAGAPGQVRAPQSGRCGGGAQPGQCIQALLCPELRCAVLRCATLHTGLGLGLVSLAASSSLNLHVWASNLTAGVGHVEQPTPSSSWIADWESRSSPYNLARFLLAGVGHAEQPHQEAGVRCLRWVPIRLPFTIMHQACCFSSARRALLNPNSPDAFFTHVPAP